jgi:acetoin utilization protein AcuB
VDTNGQVVGVITETDVFKAFIELYRAGHAGLYLTLKLGDGKGSLADLSKAIFGLGDDIVGISSSYEEASDTYRLVIKGQDLHKEQIVELVSSLGHQVTDVCEV